MLGFQRPLIAASAHGHTEVVSLLLQKNADPNCTNYVSVHI